VEEIRVPGENHRPVADPKDSQYNGQRKKGKKDKNKYVPKQKHRKLNIEQHQPH
jgi:hypothetical protein